MSRTPSQQKIADLVQLVEVQPGTFAVTIDDRECMRVEDIHWQDEYLEAFRDAVVAVHASARACERERLIALIDLYGAGLVVDLRKTVIEGIKPHA